jgi:glycogen synthase
MNNGCTQRTSYVNTNATAAPTTSVSTPACAPSTLAEPRVIPKTGLLTQPLRGSQHDKPLTVLMTTDTVGGVLVYAATLAGALRRYNVTVVLAAMGGPLSDDWKARIKALDNVICFESDYKLEWMDDPWSDVRRAGRWLEQLAERFEPDIVHLNNYAPALLDWPCPTLVVGHSCVGSWHRAVHGRPPSGRWHKYICTVKSALRRAGAVTAPTWAFLQTLTALYGPFRSIGAVYNGLDPAGRSCPKEKIAFAAGRLWDEAKNLAILKEVQPLIQIPICVAGSLEHPDGSVADSRGLTHLGHLAPPQIAGWYARLAVYVLAALYEPFGLSALEAAHAGCALVLGDLPSLREVWGGAALFVDPRDKRQIARAINLLMDVPSLRADYASKAVQRASFYSIAKMASRYFSIYDSLLKNEPAYARDITAAAL